ncbi:MAG: type IV pilin protein [Gammaproteobacteria bacterium]|nr:type IV pilin protein [Gammaproteobacteria bacterium]
MVVAIVGILMAIAIPSYNSSTAKARRTDGQTALMDVMVRQERFYTENNTYTTDLDDLPASSDSPEGYYTITAAACGGSTIDSCVILTATAGSAQASDGNLTLNSRGQKLPADKW